MALMIDQCRLPLFWPVMVMLIGESQVTAVTEVKIVALGNRADLFAMASYT